MRWMEDWPEEIVRAKGLMWLATRNSMAQSLSQAGPSIQIGPAGYWIASLTGEEQERMLQEEPGLKEDWDPLYGDRITKLVLIGIEMNREEIMRSLDACLLSAEEMGMDWSQFPDNLPNAGTADM